jgi:RNAse (barnase) inhibitor barstar
MLFVEDLAHVGWRCIHFAHADELTADLRRELTEHSVTCFDLSAAAIGGKEELMRSLAETFAFPAYFGGNWDAVLECLRDLPDRVPGDGHVLFVHDGTQLWRRAPDLAGILVETWLAAAEEAAQDEISLHLVFLDSAQASAAKG